MFNSPSNITHKNKFIKFLLEEINLYNSKTKNF